MSESKNENLQQRAFDGQLQQRVLPALLASAEDCFAVTRVEGQRAYAVPALDIVQLAAQLDAAGIGFGFSLRCESTSCEAVHDSAAPFVVAAQLNIVGVARSGLGQGYSLRDAQLVAVTEAARAYGLSLGSKGSWVSYDPKEGADFSALIEALEESLEEELLAHEEANAQAYEKAQEKETAASPQPEDGEDPQMANARQHIDALVEKIRQAGKGRQATEILLSGYGSTIEERREIYKKLDVILKGS